MALEDKAFSVLIVEGDPRDVWPYKKSLERNSRFPTHVDSARNIDEAIEKLKQDSFHLLLVDSQLQGQEGMQLFDALRETDLNIPFVLMAPVRDDRLVREAIRKGVADFIIKSESQFHELAEKLRQTYQNFYDRKVYIQPGSKIPLKSLNPNKTVSPAKYDSVPSFMIQDGLTGVYNFSYFQDRLVRECSRASRYNFPISLLLVDVDHFQSLNEKRGLAAGDALLKECAQVLFENSRLSDLVVRMEGTTFAVLLPHVGYQGAAAWAERLRRLLSEHVFLTGSEHTYLSNRNIQLTVSIGVSSFPEDQIESRIDLIEHARQALVRSKVEGRNRVICYRDLVPILKKTAPNMEVSDAKVADLQRQLSAVAERSRKAYVDATRDLILAMETKDVFTAGHSARCAKYAADTARAMGMSLDDAEIIEQAALLHDLGKIFIPDKILLKPGKLTFAEYEEMKQHPRLGYEILRPIRFLRDEADLVLRHHEWFDGKGYPDQLKGDEIPLGARVISVVDAYDTMRLAGGRYKKTMNIQEAVKELIDCSATQFDPEAVKAFVEVLLTRGELRPDEYDRELLEEKIKMANQMKGKESV